MVRKNQEVPLKKDLSHLLKQTEKIEGFEDTESAREYVARYLLNYISLEMSGLPKEEWERTVQIWKKICNFAGSLIEMPEEKRQEIYRKNNFDMMMEGIAEDVRKTIIGLKRLCLLKPTDPAERALEVAINLLEGREDLIRRWELNPEVIEFLRGFFTSKSPKRT